MKATPKKNCMKYWVYEILGFEPLHDISHHIENVLTELPEHLPKKETSELNAIIDFCIGGKRNKKGG